MQVTQAPMFRRARHELAAWLSKSAGGRRLYDWWEHQRTDVYLLSYPKCGRTWLRLLIGKALDEEFALGLDNPMELARIAHAAIPRTRVVHEFRWYQRTPLEQTKERYRDKTVLFLVRDPRDVVVSMYFNATRRQHVSTGERVDLYAGTLSEFLRHPVGGLDQIIDYYNIWADQYRVPKRFCLVRYEDMHRNAAAVLTEVFDTMHVHVSSTTIARAVDYASFENMRQLEASNAFRSHRLKPSNVDDTATFKTRKGKVAGYREHMSSDDLAYANGRIIERLSPFYADYRSAG